MHRIVIHPYCRRLWAEVLTAHVATYPRFIERLLEQTLQPLTSIKEQVSLADYCLKYPGRFIQRLDRLALRITKTYGPISTETLLSSLNDAITQWNAIPQGPTDTGVFIQHFSNRQLAVCATRELAQHLACCKQLVFNEQFIKVDWRIGLATFDPGYTAWQLALQNPNQLIEVTNNTFRVLTPALELVTLGGQSVDDLRQAVGTAQSQRFK